MTRTAAASAGESAPGVVPLDEIDELLKIAKAEMQIGDPDSAAWILEDLARRAPWHAVTHTRLGIALHHGRRYFDARNAFRRAIELEPDLSAAHHGLASSLLAMARAREALTPITRAHELDPEDADIENELGGVLMALGRRDEAAEAFERAAALRPGWPVPLQNLATVAMRTDRPERLPELIRRAEETGTVLPKIHMISGMRLLEQGEFLEGWRGYEWRSSYDGKPRQLPELPLPLWDGTPLGERALLLWTEQGFGDTLQFVRFAALVPKERGRIVLHAPAPLASVLATCPGIDQVVVDGDSVDVDLQFPLMSLPYQLNLEPAPVPPYLSALDPCPDAEKAIERGTALNVGILWASGKMYSNHASRDCPLELFAGLAEIPGVRLFSLQFGDASAELAGCSAPIIDLSPVLGDFHKTAAFVKRLDLIITVDTSLAHLAGALGAPTWTLICHGPDWRWMREREDSVWYRTMRLYRQREPGDWRPVMEHIARDLRELASGRSAIPPPPAPVPMNRRTPRPMGRIFIKQYGEQGTATNYIRAAILANYPEAEPLVHILGDKHGAPAPLDELRRETAQDPLPAFAFVTAATFGFAAHETRTSNFDQVNEIARLAAPITDAFDRGDLRYVISIKNPYAWVVSFACMYRWIAGSMPSLPDGCAEILARICRRFNRAYTAWRALADAKPDQTRIIRHEDLVRDPAAVFRGFEKQFGLGRTTPDWQDISAAVLRTHWDGWGVNLARHSFDRDYYAERRYLAKLTSQHRQIITETIDWDLCARFGYESLTD